MLGEGVISDGETGGKDIIVGEEECDSTVSWGWVSWEVDLFWGER